MNCPSCQAALDSAARFCSVCGARCRPSRTSAPIRNPYPRPIIRARRSCSATCRSRSRASSCPSSTSSSPTADGLLRASYASMEAAGRHARLHEPAERGEALLLRVADLHLDGEGPGQHRVLARGPGQIVALRLRAGQAVDVREHQFLLATSNVDYSFFWQAGIANVLFSRTGLFVDHFTVTGGEGVLLLHGYGNVFEKTLQPGEMLDVEPGAWLWKDANVRMDTVSVCSRRARAAYSARSARSSAAPRCNSIAFTDRVASACSR